MAPTWGQIRQRLETELARLPPEKQERLQRTLRRIAAAERLRWWVWLVAIGPALAVGFYCELTDSLPRRWVIGWELEWFEGYVQGSTAVLAGGAMGALWSYAVLAIALGRELRRGASGGALDPYRDVPDGAGEIRPVAAMSERRLDELGLYAAVLAVGVIPAAVGAWFWIDAARTGALVDVDVAQLERGVEPPGRYLRLRGGELRLGDAVEIGGGSDQTEVFVPVVAKGGASKQAVTVFLECGRHITGWQMSGGHGELVGTLERGGLDWRTALIERAGVKVGRRHWVIDYGSSPADDIGMGRVLVGVGAAFGFGIWLIVRRERARRRRAY